MDTGAWIGLVNRRDPRHAVVELADTLRDPGVVDLIRLTSQDETRAWDLFRHRPDKRSSFTDCTSFILMRRLGIECAATLDRDFRREGFDVLPEPS